MALHVASNDGKSGSSEVSTFKMKTGYGMPIDTASQWWAELSHTYTRTDAEKHNPIERGSKFVDNDNFFELAISYYF